MKKLLGVFLVGLGVPWIACMLSLIPIALRTSCISDAFFAREGLSFLLLPGFIFVASAGILVLLNDESGEHKGRSSLTAPAKETK